MVAALAPTVASQPGPATRPASGLSQTDYELAAAATRIPARKVVGTETDARGVKIIMRQGVWRPKARKGKGAGFGWRKIQSKHGIYSKHSVGFILKNPNGGEPDGNQRRYLAYANKLLCEDGVCKVVDNRKVYAFVDFRYFSRYYDVRINGKPGVITAYCINPNAAPKCPSWVDLAIGSEAPGVAPSNVDGNDGDAGTVKTVGSYEPITGAQLRSFARNGKASGLSSR